ncbi:DUF3558 domain-containing protein [Amycolatopsis palatopharyngis]|uniref:DUF3558 domain-containing protein n=1 Tax=Amycolatopsis palatopharyngis TaxID=187982 RepID=UPI000E286B6F|nr:DUF3558 domain-containing protein [Amycolatopsis palatopharyngis]
MRHRSVSATVLACAALILASGCDDGNAAGSPTTAPPTPATQSPSNFGAPTVENPLDTSSIDTKPCDVAKPEQMEQLPGTVGESKTEDTAAKSKSCAWLFDDEDQFSLGSVTAGTNLEVGANGLRTYYKAQAQGTLTVFEELPPVKGYPAVAYEQGGEREGKCAMAVGVRDDRVYSLTVSLRKDHPNYSEPCTIGAKIAGFAIEYLQGRQ